MLSKWKLLCMRVRCRGASKISGRSNPVTAPNKWNHQGMESKGFSALRIEVLSPCVETAPNAADIKFFRSQDQYVLQ